MQDGVPTHCFMVVSKIGLACPHQSLNQLAVLALANQIWSNKLLAMQKCNRVLPAAPKSSTLLKFFKASAISVQHWQLLAGAS